jgi:hypothetical protein
MGKTWIARRVHLSYVEATGLVYASHLRVNSSYRKPVTSAPLLCDSREMRTGSFAVNSMQVYTALSSSLPPTHCYTLTQVIISTQSIKSCSSSHKLDKPVSDRGVGIIKVSESREAKPSSKKQGVFMHRLMQCADEIQSATCLAGSGSRMPISYPRCCVPCNLRSSHLLPDRPSLQG